MTMVNDNGKQRIFTYNLTFNKAGGAPPAKKFPYGLLFSSSKRYNDQHQEKCLHDVVKLALSVDKQTIS